MRILLVGDEPRVAGFIAKGVRELAYAVDIAADGEEALYAASENDYDDLRIVVSDTGIGIPTEAAAHVFERFYRVDKARSRQDGGFGLGLAIAKWIAESHNGKMELASSPEGGSTFTVTLGREKGKGINGNS